MAPFADGSPQASQWPIPPGHFFDYEILTQCGDSGTYYYHSHVGLQAVTASGPLIVDDSPASPTYHYDEERILHFQDYFSASDSEIMSSKMDSKHRYTGGPNGVLLNGKGVATRKTVSAGPPRSKGGKPGNPVDRLHSRGSALPRTHTDATDDGAGCGLPVIDVEPGKAYRFRFIGATGLSLLTMGIEGHPNITIVQVDGSEYNVPVTTDHLQIAAGQRFDVIFTAKTSEELAADGNKATYFIQYETRGRHNPYIGYAALRYSPDSTVPAAPSAPVISLPEEVNDWMEYTFTPLFPDRSKAPTAAEVTRRVIIDCDLAEDPETGRVVWEMAHQTWTEEKSQTPALVDIYLRGQAAIPNYEAALRNHGWDPATGYFPAKMGEVLEIVLQNRGAKVGNSGVLDTHPFHSHGKHYFDIGSGPGKYDAEANNAKLERLGYKPISRDTTMLYQYHDAVAPGEPDGWRAWRVRVGNPGVWMMHCHVLAHMMMGMQSVWVAGEAEDIMELPPSVSAGYYTYGGSVMGNATNPPEVYEYYSGNTGGIEAGC